MRLLLVLAGGALGSGARSLIAVALAERSGGSFPWGTLAVNIAGSFLVGLLATVADEVGSVGPNGRVFLIVGVLGGFTTFSAFSLETLRLAEHHNLTRALLTVGASLVLGLAAAVIGIMVGRAFSR